MCVIFYLYLHVIHQIIAKVGYDFHVCIQVFDFNVSCRLGKILHLCGWDCKFWYSIQLLVYKSYIVIVLGLCKNKSKIFVSQ